MELKQEVNQFHGASSLQYKRKSSDACNSIVVAKVPSRDSLEFAQLSYQASEAVEHGTAVSEVLMIKGTAGLIPASDEAVEWLRKKKTGATVLVEAREVRNGAFFRKWFALVKLGYDYWSEDVVTMEYKGTPVQPDFDRFRRDVTILAGHYHPVVNLKGEVRLEADSLKWASMSEETFSKLYDKTITVLLQRVFNGRVCKEWSEEELRRVAEQILEFAA